MAQIISPIPPIEPGEERVIHTTWYYDPNKDPVVFNLEAIADYYSGIEELREDNNNLIKEFTMKEPQLLAYIIVHCHNPEDKEINSIDNVGWYNATIYNDDVVIGYGTHNAETHNVPISILSGHHTIKVVFNGITLTQIIDIDSGSTQILTFTFTRVTAPNLFGASAIYEGEIDAEYNYGGLGAVSVRAGTYPEGVVSSVLCYMVSPTPMCNERVHAEFTFGSDVVDVYAEAYAKVYPDISPGRRDITEHVLSNYGFRANVSIPSRTDFSVWYAQDNVVGAVRLVELRLVSGSYISSQIMGIGWMGPQTFKVDAYKTYDKIEVLNTGGSAPYKHYAPYTTQESTISFSHSVNVNGSNFRISSIPYDVVGTSV
jgi:hypothetical protein